MPSTSGKCIFHPFSLSFIFFQWHKCTYANCFILLLLLKGKRRQSMKATRIHLIILWIHFEYGIQIYIIASKFCVHKSQFEVSVMQCGRVQILFDFNVWWINVTVTSVHMCVSHRKNRYWLNNRILEHFHSFWVQLSELFWGRINTKKYDSQIKCCQTNRTSWKKTRAFKQFLI